MGHSPSATTPPPRRAGRAQGFTLIGLSVMPTLVIAALVSDLPQMFEHFASVPNHAFLVPMIITVPSLCVALFSWVAGVIADRWGRRNMLLVALLAFSVLGLMPMLFDSLPAIIACRVVVGLAEACILTGCNALFGDYFADDERKRWLGWQQMAVPFFNAGLAAAGGVLAAHDWRAPFWLYALGLPVAAMVWRYGWEPERAQPSTRAAAVTLEPFAWRAAGRVCGITLLASVVFFTMAIQQGRILNAVGVTSPATIGLLIMFIALGAVAGGAVFQRLRQWRFAALLALGMGCYGLGFIGLSGSHHAFGGFAFSVLAMVGSSVLLPAMIAWALSSFAPSQRGRAMGVWGATFFAGQFVSAPLLTLLEQARGGLLPALGALGVATLLVAAVSAYWASRPVHPSSLPHPETPL